MIFCCSTKFIGGHEDLCAGVLTTRTSQQWKKIMHTRQLFGGILVRIEIYLAILVMYYFTLHIFARRS